MTETQRRPNEGHQDDVDDQLESQVGTDDAGPRSVVLGMWREAKAASKRASQARRARVLAQPDLAQRLTCPPLRLSDPSRWSGWIPPKTLAEEACTHCEHSRRCSGWPHRCKVNDSPARRQLVGIAAEAMHRDSADQESP